LFLPISVGFVEPSGHIGVETLDEGCGLLGVGGGEEDFLLPRNPVQSVRVTFEFVFKVEVDGAVRGGVGSAGFS